MTIQDVNDVVSTAFAGRSTGQIYENERRFDLVVRLDTTHRNSIDDVRNLMIPTDTGTQIPLSQVAAIDYKLGPAQISREAGKRRIVIGFNVAGRDVQTVVKDIQQQLAANVKLPAGYYFTYGGQFENLQKASSRLLIAVPVSLLLIFMLLYFTFHSFKQATLIFTAIPMSAIGGVFALMLRGMPFSISAGIGFIALFGVAVLNGIVLIGTFNQLKKEGVDDIFQRVKEGTLTRLRPVLMTATVASLGFLPMAISTSAGAEVQKPLATVVIGGLVTATFLTLFVLPLLYIIFNSKLNMKRSRGAKTIVTILAFLFMALGSQVFGQERISVTEAVETALKNNRQFQINQAEIVGAGFNVKTATEIPKTGIFAENEDYRPTDKAGLLKIGITQSIAWPGLYTARKAYFKEQLKYVNLNTDVLKTAITKDVRTAYFQLWYLQDRQKLYMELDSIYTAMFKATELRFRTGDVAALDKIAAEAKLKELQAQLVQNKKDIIIQQQQLMMLLDRNEWMLPLDQSLEKIVVDASPSDETAHPLLVLQQQNVNIASSNISVQKNTNKPEFSGRFFSQRVWGAKDPLSGFSVSASFPVFSLGAYKSKVKVANAEMEVQQRKLEYDTQVFQTNKGNALAEIDKNSALLQFYESSGLKQADAIIKAASLGYRTGEINFAELSQFLSQAIGIRQNYLEVLNQYNQSAIQYNYFNNK